jgi:putative OPT family oligopeptide transporter
LRHAAASYPVPMQTGKTAAAGGAPERELTPLVLILGVGLSLVMGAANVYVGLKAGMTVSASIPAAVMAMLVLRVVLRRGSVLQANQVQTCASAGESLAAGIIFTVPALVLAGAWSDFDYWTTSAIAIGGGLLGVLFMIPMRRVFITDNSELPYPEGLACAAVLEAGEGRSGATGAGALLGGGLLGILFKLGADGLGLLLTTVERATAAGSRVLYYGADASPMLVAVGYIVRLNVALLVFLGGALSWIVALPLLDAGPLLDGAAPLDAAWELWSSKVRFIGVGAMVLGGVVSIVQVRSGLVEAVRVLRARLRGEGDAQDEDRDLPTGLLLTVGLLSVLAITWVYWTFTGSAAITALLAVVMVLLAFFMTAVASYIVGLVGNSNSPVSGMTITAVLVAGALLALVGYSEGMEALAAILGVAAVVCCVACTAGDVCNDLKTGALVGATPRRQQLMQVLGVVSAALILAPVLQVLHEGTEGGIGGPKLAAPQAQLFKSIAEGFTGGAALPWDMVGLGAAFGVVVLLADRALAARGSGFRLHLMPLAVGMYLPFGLGTPILIGGVMAHLLARGAKDEAAADRRLHGGVLFGSGVIAGESLTAVGLAILAVYEIEGSSLLPESARESLTLPATLAASLAAVWLFWRAARRGARMEA